jgi:hypothetical protein
MQKSKIHDLGLLQLQLFMNIIYSRSQRQRQTIETIFWTLNTVWIKPIRKEDINTRAYNRFELARDSFDM